MNDKQKKSRGIITYKTYSFVDKDPVIDELRTMMQDEGAANTDIALASGVSSSTLYNWFDGSTRRPQYATIAAVAGALGYEMTFKPKHGRGNVVPFKRFQRDRLKRHAG